MIGNRLRLPLEGEAGSSCWATPRRNLQGDPGQARFFVQPREQRQPILRLIPRSIGQRDFQPLWTTKEAREKFGRQASILANIREQPYGTQ